MPTSTALALLAASTLLAGPAKQAWESTEAKAMFLPRSALVEVDGKEAGRGFVALDVKDPARAFRVRVTADGFEPEEAVVVAGQVANKQYAIALRPSGLADKVDPKDAASLARAADVLWRAGRTDDAADYADLSLRTGNTALANRVMGDVWRRRGDRDRAIQHYTMYVSLTSGAPDPEIKAWLLQDRPGDIVMPPER